MLFGGKQKSTVITEEEESQSQYAPAALGLPGNSTLQNSLEFFVLGTRKNDCGPEKILQTLLGHGAKLIAINSYPRTPDGSSYLMSCVIDPTDLDCQSDQLLIMFRKMRGVERAEKSKMGGKTFSNYLFPLNTGNNVRSVVFEAESILSLEASLKRGDNDPSNEKKISNLFMEHGRRQAAKIFRDYIQSDKVTKEKMKEYISDSIKGYLMGTGWGVCSEGPEQDFQTIHVTDPPILNDGDKLIAGGSYLTGIIAGFLESRMGGNARLSLIQERYAKERRVLTLHFAKEDVVQANEEYMKTLDQKIGVAEAVASEIKSESNEQMERKEGRELATNTSIDFVTALSAKVPGNAGLGDLQVVISILKVATTGVPKLNLMNSAKLTMLKANEYIERMMKAGLLEARKNPSTGFVTYYSTEKGTDFQRVQEKLELMLREE